MLPRLCRACSLVALAAATCAGRAPAQRAPGGSGAPAGASCSLVEVRRGPLVLPDGRELYVEPQLFGATPAGYLLIGQPSYEGVRGPDGTLELAATRTFLGVEMRGDELVPLSFPEGVAHVSDVRGARLGADRWAVLLQEVDTPVIGGSKDVRVVYSERSGGAWSPVEELPLPVGTRVSLTSSSSLVSVDGEPLWAARVDRAFEGIDVYAFARRATGWDSVRISERWVDDVGLTMGTQGPVAAIGGLDAEFGARRASLRIAFRRGVRWSAPLRVAEGSAGERLWTPVPVATDDGVDVAYLHVDATGTRRARVILGVDGAGPWASELLDERGFFIETATLADGTPVVVTYHVDATGAGELRVFRRVPGGYHTVGAVAYPYQGPFALAADPSGDLLVVGPEMVRGPVIPSVRSLLLRLSLRCS